MAGRRSDQSWEIHDVQVCAGTMLIKDTSGPIQFTGAVVQVRPGAPEHSVGVAAGKQGIKGLLLTPTGEAIPDGKVVAVQAANHAPHSTTTDQSGSFSFAGLEPGTYSLTFSAPGFENQTVPNLQVVAGYARLQDGQLCHTTRR